MSLLILFAGTATGPAPTSTKGYATASDARAKSSTASDAAASGSTASNA